jgi:hypothetical protein
MLSSNTRRPVVSPVDPSRCFVRAKALLRTADQFLRVVHDVSGKDEDGEENLCDGEENLCDGERTGGSMTGQAMDGTGGKAQSGGLKLPLLTISTIERMYGWPRFFLLRGIERLRW